MTSQEKSFERVNQKRRTRAELLRAARELVEKGAQPSVADVADHAGISRATAYRYFSKPEDMIREALLDAIAIGITPQAHVPGTELDAGRALGDLVRQVWTMSEENEAMFRSFLAGSITGRDGVKRGGRRLEWLDTVLEPLKGSMPKADYVRLLHGLGLVTGIETLIVLKDVCGLDSVAAEEVALWAAQMLLAGATRKISSETHSRRRDRVGPPAIAIVSARPWECAK